MEARSLNGNRTAFQGSGLHGEMTLMTWPNSGLPLTFGHHRLVCETTCWEYMWLQCASQSDYSGAAWGRGRAKDGIAPGGNAKQTAALVTINTIPCAKCTAVSCGQCLLWVQTQPPPKAI